MNSKNIYKDIEDLFASPPNANQKAWGIINDFYHMILTFMEENKISKADLAKRLRKSRSAISQMFNKTPNLTIKKMVEIADAIGMNIKVTSKEVPLGVTKPEKEYLVFVVHKQKEEVSFPVTPRRVYHPHHEGPMEFPKEDIIVVKGKLNYN